MSIDDDIDNLKRRHSTAVKMRLRAEARLDAAQRTLDACMQELRERYGINDLGEARTVLADLQQSVLAGIDAANQALTTAEQQ